MTIGIAAICDGGKAVVLAADRLVSYGTYSLEIEGEERKIIGLTPGTAVAATGNCEDSTFILQRLRHSAELMATGGVLTTAERMRTLCEERRNEQVERTITKPLLQMSYKQFAATCVGKPSTPIMIDVFKEIQKMAFQLKLIVAGVDVNGAHLYTVTNEAVNDHASTGFVVIGCGSFTALDAIVSRRKIFTSRPLAETIYSLYAAKRLTECVQGVGKATDIAVVRQGKKTKFLKRSQVKELARMYRRMQPPTLSDKDASVIAEFLH